VTRIIQLWQLRRDIDLDIFSIPPWLIPSCSYVGEMLAPFLGIPVVRVFHPTQPATWRDLPLLLLQELSLGPS
jgi:hypothetical protein